MVIPLLIEANGPVLTRGLRDRPCHSGRDRMFGALKYRVTVEQNALPLYGAAASHAPSAFQAAPTGSA